MDSQLLTQQKNINTEDNCNYSLEQTQHPTIPTASAVGMDADVFLTSQLADLYLFDSFDFKISLFLRRLINCYKQKWAYVVCRYCGERIINNPVLLTCLSPYCNNPECVENRRQLAYKKLKSYNIRASKLIHLIFGFERIMCFSPDIRREHHKIIDEFANEMEKLGTPLHIIIVRDLTGKSFDYFIHYHGANLPVKDYRVFHRNINIAREKVCQKLSVGFTVRSKHYRSKEWMFNYFANRMAGIFGDVKANKNYSYQDIMGAKEYYLCFYNTRRIEHINLNPSKRRGNVPFMLQELPDSCSNCGCKLFKLILVENWKPPGGFYCKSCGYLEDYKDLLPAVESCRVCSKTSSPEHKMMKTQQEFANYLQAKEKSHLSPRENYARNT